MENKPKPETYYLEEASIEAESEDGFEYEEIPAEDIYSIDGTGGENFEEAVQTARAKESNIVLQTSPTCDKPVTRKIPEVTEDFVSNFLVRLGMLRTLDSFQTEWYELKEKGILADHECSNVPDVYVRNRQLAETVDNLKNDVKKYSDAAQKAKASHLKLRKERDFHKIHHKRVEQEKERLVSDIKRMRSHYASYEPTLRSLQHKYEVAMREKMLTKLERDRAIGQIEGLQSTVKLHSQTFKNTGESENKKEFKPRTSSPTKPLSPTKYENDSEWPADKGANPLLSKTRKPCLHLTRTGGFRLSSTIKTHQLPVSSLALHPRKQILATASDDQTWKLWSLPDAENIITGEGHTGWLADCDFHPKGGHLATASGDTSVKVWNFTTESCVASFDDHTHAVWGCSWHSAGDFLASASMDGTCKLWDLNSVRCRGTLRGHTDSVNSIQFLPFSNILCTASADKTISLWDARTGLCGHTFYGHSHAINDVSFNLQGEMLVSCDAYGVMKLWDIRTASPLHTYDMGPHPLNRVTFDPDSTVVAGASNDRTVKMYEIASGDVTQLSGHQDSVLAVLFDRNAQYLVSAASDGSVCVWS